MAARSPMTYAEGIARANLKIFHGKYDPVVPVSHSIELYDRVGQIDPEARVFLDIFDGGHEIDLESAFHWLLSQCEKKVVTAVT
jgi:predicted esterase